MTPSRRAGYHEISNSPQQQEARNTKTAQYVATATAVIATALSLFAVVHACNQTYIHYNNTLENCLELCRSANVNKSFCVHNNCDMIEKQLGHNEAGILLTSVCLLPLAVIATTGASYYISKKIGNYCTKAITLLTTPNDSNNRTHEQETQLL